MKLEITKAQSLTNVNIMMHGMERTNGTAIKKAGIGMMNIKYSQWRKAKQKEKENLTSHHGKEKEKEKAKVKEEKEKDLHGTLGHLQHHGSSNSHTAQVKKAELASSVEKQDTLPPIAPSTHQVRRESWDSRVKEEKEKEMEKEKEIK